MRRRPASLFFASYLVVAAMGFAATVTTGCGGSREEGDGGESSGGGTTDGSSTSDASSTSDGSGTADTTAGSGTTDTTGMPDACFDYSTFDGTRPSASFLVDVLPVFQQSCGLSMTCHGSQVPVAPNHPYLGPSPANQATPQDIEEIFAQIVGVASVTEPSLAIVTPGEPESSILMHKLDATLECDALACAQADGCGAPMPLRGTQLPDDQRDAIRRWIAQGAQNN